MTLLYLFECNLHLSLSLSTNYNDGLRNKVIGDVYVLLRSLSLCVFVTPYGFMLMNNNYNGGLGKKVIGCVYTLR